MKNILFTFLYFFLLLVFINNSCYETKNNSTNSSTSINENQIKTDLSSDKIEQIIKTISVSEAQALINSNKNNSDFIIIDIRTENEYMSGYIRNAINIDFYNPLFEENIKKLDINKKYLIYCRSGNRSGKALNMMKNLNFKEVYNMSGGIIAWNQAGYELIK